MPHHRLEHGPGCRFAIAIDDAPAGDALASLYAAAGPRHDRSGTPRTLIGARGEKMSPGRATTSRSQPGPAKSKQGEIREPSSKFSVALRWSPVRSHPPAQGRPRDSEGRPRFRSRPAWRRRDGVRRRRFFSCRRPSLRPVSRVVVWLAARSYESSSPAKPDSMHERLDFVQRANASYLEEMYARFRSDPASVPEEWALFFAGFDFGSDRAGIGAGGRVSGQRVRPGARLPRVRSPDRAARSAERTGAGSSAARSRAVRVRPRGSRPPDRPTAVPRPRARHPARADRRAARDLLRHARGRIRGHPGSRAARVAARAHGAPAQSPRAGAAGARARAPHAAGRRRVRAIPSGEVRRPEAVLARGRRHADSDARLAVPRPRPASVWSRSCSAAHRGRLNARQRARQAARADPRRVRANFAPDPEGMAM